MSKPILQCRSVSKHFAEGNLHVDVLKQVDLTVEEGDTIAIIGASGSGKSTLLHCLGGLDLPSDGQVLLQGSDLAKQDERRRGMMRNRYLGFIYQFHHLLPEFTAEENVAMPLLIAGENIHDASSRAHAELKAVGLEHRVNHKPAEMSGGERQRAAIARALVTKPQCILADEPTGNLDEKTSEAVFATMMTLNQDYSCSFVMVTHNQTLAKQMDKVFTLQDGRLKEGY